MNNWLTFRGIGELDLLSGKPSITSPNNAENDFCTFSTDVMRKDMKKDDQTLEYTFNTEKSEANALIDFLPSYELYPGSKARIAVLLNGEEIQTVSVPNSDSLKEENGPRSTLILDNFARVVVPLKNLKKGENKFTIRAVDPGVSVRAVYLPNK